MPKPKKGEIYVNQDYLKTWDDYQSGHKSKVPLLLPISIDIENGSVVRERINSDDIADMQEALLAEFEEHCKSEEGYIDGAYCVDDFSTMLDEYVAAFSSDNSESVRPQSPLDFAIIRPVWFMFYLPRKKWTFSKHRQYSMENDRDDFMRNCEKVCTLDGGHILLLANHCRSTPKGLKYNLHVTISQKEGRKTLRTNIIIDPGMDNGDRGGPDVKTIG